jgi:eukaryotic-like serine/threonine-protein kinase
VVSAGPPVPVPNVVGKQYTSASQLITNARLTIKTTYVTSNKPSGTVLKQSPAGGASVKAGSVVTLTVSSSQTSATVPNVVGHSQADAGSLITNANFTVGTQTSACSQQVATGDIASQSPAAGTQEVPDVIQETQAAANAAISGTAGLTPAFTPVDCTQSGGTPGTVQSEDPSAGTVLQPPFPQTVTMTVCQQSTSTTTTSSGGSTTTTTSSSTPTSQVREPQGATTTPPS